jgi:hypothetical protein
MDYDSEGDDEDYDNNPNEPDSEGDATDSKDNMDPNKLANILNNKTQINV